MISALHAVVNERGVLRILHVPISHANERFLILAAPYPLPNGTNKRIFNRAEPILPDSPTNAVRYYLAFLNNQREDNLMIIRQLDARISAGQKFMDSLAPESVAVAAVATDPL